MTATDPGGIIVARLAHVGLKARDLAKQADLYPVIPDQWGSFPPGMPLPAESNPGFGER